MGSNKGLVIFTPILLGVIACSSTYSSFLLGQIKLGMAHTTLVTNEGGHESGISTEVETEPYKQVEAKYEDLPHFTECSKEHWPSSYYAPKEFAQRSGNNMGKVLVAKTFLKMLDDLARCYSEKTDTLDFLPVTSCFRDPSHNSFVGGIEHSKHVAGLSCDFRIGTLQQNQAIENCAKEVSSNGRYLEFIRKRTHIHIEEEMQLVVSTRLYSDGFGKNKISYSNKNGKVFEDENACVLKK